MEFPKKQLLLVGDRVLITPEEGEDRMRAGLYLPPTAVDAMQVQSGLVIAVGPGDPVADMSGGDDEPWKIGERQPRWRPMQARVGDHASSSGRRRWKSPSRKSGTWWCRRQRYSF